jgi:hypothetical protein
MTKKTINKNDYYNTINECFVFNWRQCLAGDYTFTRKDLNVGTEEMDALAWINIYDDYIKQVGLGKNYEFVLEMRRDLAILQCDFIITNNRFLLNNINTLTDDINEALKNAEKSGEDMTTTLLRLSKWAGFKLDERTTTVLELHKMIDLVKQQAAKQTNNTI